MSKPIEELWPPFGLKITCGTVTLSPVRDTDIPELDALAHAGIHAPSEMPFYFPWTVGSTGEVRLRLMQYHWAQRAAMSPASWTLETTVRFDGEVVGCQSISTKGLSGDENRGNRLMARNEASRPRDRDGDASDPLRLHVRSPGRRRGNLSSIH